jgi:hypothetical protein
MFPIILIMVLSGKISIDHNSIDHNYPRQFHHFKTMEKCETVAAILEDQDRDVLLAVCVDTTKQ